MTERQQLKTTVSGSFNRYLQEVREDVAELQGLGVEVLSPKDPKPVGYAPYKGPGSEFVRLRGDRWKDPARVENEHLRAIAQSDFLWVVAPGGYIGEMAAHEIGFALGRQVLIYSRTVLSNPSACMYRRFFRQVRDIPQAVEEVRRVKPVADEMRRLGPWPLVVGNPTRRKVDERETDEFYRIIRAPI